MHSKCSLWLRVHKYERSIFVGTVHIYTQTNCASTTLIDHTKFMHQQQHNLSQVMHWKCTHTVNEPVYRLWRGNTQCSACFILFDFVEFYSVSLSQFFSLYKKFFSRKYIESFPSAGAHFMLIFIELKVKEQYTNWISSIQRKMFIDAIAQHTQQQYNVGAHIYL